MIREESRGINSLGFLSVPLTERNCTCEEKGDGALHRLKNRGSSCRVEDEEVEGRECMVTIFTPIYNRKHTIGKLYESLKRQTDRRFEWIVIDDGSTDDVEELIRQWEREECDFPIRFRRVPNGGKHRAVNLGVGMAEHEAFFIVDSDDHLVPEAVEFVNLRFKEIEGDMRFAGISGLRGLTEDSPVGGWPKFGADYVDATNLERKKFHLLGDKAEVYKTSILKKFPFPCFEKENFLTEGIVWDRIAREGYQIRWFKKVIYLCAYLEDGLTRAGFRKFLDNPCGYAAYLDIQEEIYGKERVFSEKVRFYILLKAKFGEQRAVEKMGIPKEEQGKMEKHLERMLADANRFFSSGGFRDIAIYGLGMVGNEFLGIAKHLEVNVKYAIDQKEKTCGEIKVFTLEDALEDVDAVVITLKDYNPDVRKKLESRFRRVFYWRDITEQYFDWDFRTA